MLDKYNGCFLGLAVGDALGAPVEFLTRHEILQRYGDPGIQDFEEWDNRKAGSYTDDTQMSLATAIGCIRARQQILSRRTASGLDQVYREYVKWAQEQTDPAEIRFPGSTCLEALRGGRKGTIDNPINDSKGCGGVMRAAPVGLAFPPDMAFREGADYAALTHGHPSGYLPAGFLAELIAWIVEGRALRDAIGQSLVSLAAYEGCSDTRKKIELVLKLVSSFEEPAEAVVRIGEGWVGDEALAIALYCSLKFVYDFRLGVLCAVNHSGDSDTTGSITGAILGTVLGDQNIPEKWRLNLENSFQISQTAVDMYKTFQRSERLSAEKYFVE